MRQRAFSHDVPVSRPGDLREKQADALAQRAGEPPPLATQPRAPVQALDDDVRRWAEPRLGHDFSAVRIHAGDRAHEEATALDARAFTLGNDITFARGELTPPLLAHELAHVALDRGAARQIHRKTKGEAAVDKAHTDYLDPDASVKADVDVLKAALKEIKAGTNIKFNQPAGKKKIASALKTLGKSKDLPAAETEWDALVKDHKSSGTKAYRAKEKAFLKRFETPLAALSAQHPKSAAKYWLKNTPPKVVDEIYAAADADMPADQLYTYAMREGLVDYIRSQAGVSGKTEPTATQLAGVSTTSSISGFDYLGTDDFFTELTSSSEPLTNFLPTGYDTTKLTKDPRVNEHGRTVQSAIFPNLKTGLQALAATMKRRRKLFRNDVSTYGYATPTTEELVYWTYVYYNAGEFNGQLKKFSGKRKLSDWITKGEYDNSIKVLESWKMLSAMKLF